MADTTLALARYRRLALRTTETFQGGIYPFPSLIADASGDPRRAHGVAWRSVRTNLMWTEVEDLAGTADVDLAIAALLHFLKKYDRELMGRPARFELTDAPLADALRARLADPEAQVVVVPVLPEVEEALRDVSNAVDDEDGSTRLVDAPGVTPEQLQAFATAAAAFYHAAPWHGLAPTDVMQLDSDGIPPDLRAVVITGDPPGLLLFANDDQAREFLAGDDDERLDPWAIAFGAIEELSFADASAWGARGLAVAGPYAFPRVHGPGEDATVPTPDEIAGLTVVLAALAASAEDEIDTGAWTRTVPTLDGPIDVQLSLPGVLAAGEPGAPDADVDLTIWAAVQEEREALGLVEEPAPDAPPAVRAQALALAAMAATGRRQLQLARRALAIDPGCADALRVLAIRTADLDAALPIYRQALAAAEDARAQATPPSPPPSWNDVATRPYIRARLALGSALDARSEYAEALQHFAAVLDSDPQGVSIARDLLLETLIRAGAKDDAQALIDRFASDPRAVWAYAAALVAFWRQGDGADSRARLAAALAANPHAVPYLVGTRDIEEPVEPIEPGSPEEGADIADRLIDLWDQVPEAVAWLKSLAPRDKRGRR